MTGPVAPIELPATAEDRALSAADLSDLMRAFNEVTGKLESTQRTLRAEVGRLQGELEQANRRLRRSRELAALGEMAAGIAHEIRNPLGSIRLYAEALEEDLAGQESPRGMARKIGAAVVGLDRIVGDVLAFARELRLHVGPAEPAALLAGAVDDARAELLESGAVVEIDAVDDVLIDCDADLIRRALVNLVRNAAEACRESDRRSVRLIAEAGSRRDADGRRTPCLVLAVEDAGPGIPEDVLPRMFNPFFTTRAAGTGLGLAIVHRIVDAHGGAVEVGRAAAGGARVAILLPLESGCALEPSTAPETRQPHGRTS